MHRVLMTTVIALSVCGCASGPLLDNPILLRPDRAIPHGNPLYIPQDGTAYAKVFDATLDVVSDYFTLGYHSRYEGRIETQPSIAPGIEQPWKPGSPDLYQRLLAFCQTIRHRAVVTIMPAENNGGYFIDVKVFKELLDQPRPIRSTAGDATFRLEDTVQRQFEIIEPEFLDAGWIPIGRDTKLEQCLLDRLTRLNCTTR